VTYDGNLNDTGTVPVDGSSPYTSGSPVTVLTNSGSLTKTGFVFSGWNTLANGLGTNRAEGSTFAMGSANVTLYAKWEVVPTTWLNTGITDANWNSTDNWVGGIVPGSTAPITGSNANADEAIFDTAPGTYGTAGNPVVIDSTSENIKSITFTGTAGDFVIGSTVGNPLYLSSTGTIQIPGTLTATNATETINAPLVIEGASGTYAITNNSADGTGANAGILHIGGGITGGAAGATVLTLGGTNTNANAVSGVIDKGSATSLAITKAGTGTWMLSGANSYAGATSITGGTLKLGATGGALDSPLGTIFAGTTVASGAALDLNGFTLGTAEALSITGTGVLTTGALKNSGAAATYSGVVTLTGAASIGGSGDITLTSGLVGNSVLTKVGAGALSLDAASSRTGATLLDAGKLNINNASALGTNTLTFNAPGTTIDNTGGGGALVLANALAVATGATNDFSVFNSLSTSTSDLSFTGTAMLAIPSSGNGTRTITLNGTGTTLSLGAVTAQTNAAGGKLQINGPGNTLVMASLITNTNTGTRNFTLQGTANVTINGVVSNPAGTGWFAMSGTGTLILKGASSTYTGLTKVNSGTVIAGASAPSTTGDGVFGNAISEITLGEAGGVFPIGDANASILTGGAYTIGRIIRIPTSDTTDVGTRVLTLGGNTADNSEFSGNIILGTNSQAGRGVTLTAASGGQVTFSGVIQNPATMDATTYTVTKSGLGTVVLSGINTYTGDTNVSAGTLVLADNAGMKFVVTNGSNNKITGPGTATLNGDFTIDTSAVTSGPGPWTLVDTNTKTFTSDFSVTGGFLDPENDGSWTKVDPIDSTKTWTFTEDGVLTLTVIPVGGYAAWAQTNITDIDPLADATPAGDADNDGLTNLMEYALGKSPTVSSQPAGVLSGKVITFTKGTEAVTNGDVTYSIETSTNLLNEIIPGDGGWATPTTGVVETTEPPRTISYTLPDGVLGGKVFARLVVTQN
jgi:uncharacterized repeat protein (TIGR02543 family)